MRINQGVVTNIGIHFFDMLSWIFGDIQENNVYLREKDKASDYLEFSKARVRWFLSIDENSLPNFVKEKGQKTFQSITINKEELEFSSRFTDLQTESYKSILKGNGFGLLDAKQSVDIVYKIRNQRFSLKGEKHPFLFKK